MNRFNSQRQSKERTANGVGIITIVTICSFIIFPALAFLAFELSRVYLANQQLQNASDAAALTAVAQLASQDIHDSVKAHTDAMDAALKIFKSNHVIGQVLTHSTIASSTTDLQCAPGEARLFFEFINPRTKKVEPISSPDSKVVRITSQFGSETAFGKFLGIKDFNVRSISDAAVPMLDLVLCFDVSGSMDDQTESTVVTRKWSAALGKITYSTPVGNHGPMRGKIFDFVQPLPTGTSFNGLEPQALTDAFYSSDAYFSEWLAAYYGVPGLRSGGVYPENGQPPGNFPPGTAPTNFGVPIYTDLVVNLDGNATFSGFTHKGFAFPDVATLVEASRGNLEDSVSFSKSKANTSVSVTPKPGYQQAYREASMKSLQPLEDSKDASLLFNRIMNTNTDCHFGFVAFDTEIGNSPSSTESWNALCWRTPYGSVKNFPLPMVQLDSTTGNTNFGQSNSAIQTCLPLGGTNIGAALHKAVETLKANTRKGAVKAIVLFTDGQPSHGGPLDSDPWTNARKAAVEAKNEGIAIYTIGLAQNPIILAGEKAILNDTDPNPSTGGVAAIAGNGGIYNPVTDSKQLRVAFEKIARRLVDIVTFDVHL